MPLLLFAWLMVPWFLYIQWQRDPVPFQVFWHTLSSLATHPVARTQEAFAFWGVEGTLLWFYPSVIMCGVGMVYWWLYRR